MDRCDVDYGLYYGIKGGQENGSGFVRPGPYILRLPTTSKPMFSRVLTK